MTWEEKLRQTELLSAQRASQLSEMHEQMSDLERQLEASERARKQAAVVVAVVVARRFMIRQLMNGARCRRRSLPLIQHMFWLSTHTYTIHAHAHAHAPAHAHAQAEEQRVALEMALAQKIIDAAGGSGRSSESVGGCEYASPPFSSPQARAVVGCVRARPRAVPPTVCGERGAACCRCGCHVAIASSPSSRRARRHTAACLCRMGRTTVSIWTTTTTRMREIARARCAGRGMAHGGGVVFPPARCGMCRGVFCGGAPRPAFESSRALNSMRCTVQIGEWVKYLLTYS